jgi:hypothetical protein
LILTWAKPARAREASVAAQAFAVFGVGLGLFTIAVGAGPRTAADVAYHAGILIVLLVGLAISLRTPPA